MRRSSSAARPLRAVLLLLTGAVLAWVAISGAVRALASLAVSGPGRTIIAVALTITTLAAITALDRDLTWFRR